MIQLSMVEAAGPHFAAEIRIGIVSVLERFQAFPTLQNLTRDTSCTSLSTTESLMLISIFIFVNQTPISVEFLTRICGGFTSQIQWNYIAFWSSSRKIKHGFGFTYFQVEFGANTLWIWSTHEYYNFTNGELQTPTRNDFRTTSIFWSNSLFLWDFHLNRHRPSRTSFYIGDIDGNRRLVHEDENRY